jgi:hypothetical protein
LGKLIAENISQLGKEFLAGITGGPDGAGHVRFGDRDIQKYSGNEPGWRQSLRSDHDRRPQEI